MSQQVFFAVYDPATGEIHRSGVTSQATFALIPRPGESIVASPLRVPDFRSEYVNTADGTILARPALSVPSSGASGVDIVMPTVPDGTSVHIEGADQGQVTGGAGLTINFPSAGTWKINLAPPFPWMPYSGEVVVT